MLHWAGQSRRWQNSLLVLASYLFYGWWDYRFCGLMVLSSLVDYGLGIYVANAKTQSQRKWALTTSVVCNLGLLGFFKYCNFFSDSLVGALGAMGWTVHPLMSEILLPVGISFYTFQTLSYTIDIFRGKLQPTTNLIDYLAFVSFFPQLVAGPIERATNLIPQFSRARTFSNDQAVEGCRTILWGFAKKLIIADHLAVCVDAIYANPGDVSGLSLLIGTVFFAWQIYCDFSAYSDIAIGTAKLFGINLMQNFNYPYLSQSVTEFWRRWHISLSTWFRDYVFIPLGGSQGTRNETYRNLMITFVLSGLWHGAAWRFIIWGAINGAALVVEKAIRSSVEKDGSRQRLISGHLLNPDADQRNRDKTSFAGQAALQAMLRMTYTFSVICLGWVFFRASTSAEAFMILSKIVTIPLYDLNASAWKAALATHPSMEKMLFVLIGYSLLEWMISVSRVSVHFLQWPTPARWAVFTIVIWGTIQFTLTTETNPFIYFQF
ncbi:membrane bound O-acyl transferase MBOAT family protein [Rhodopirellula maiorica SM1]|uniref:Membrane bound O-acyl transferase MBOAT family protein n=2 Tax=Novipirellula TaxID=2795426 RepID=M5R7S0_9BACT|nr:membrane bound O-acyl transferase MBOAT family protein [Rhodopirellula maiorica SM1]